MTELALRFPIDLPGGTVDRMTIDLDRPGVVDMNEPITGIARIVGLPVPVLREMAEFDYVRLLLAIDELNTAQLTLREVR